MNAKFKSRENAEQKSGGKTRRLFKKKLFSSPKTFPSSYWTLVRLIGALEEDKPKHPLGQNVANR